MEKKENKSNHNREKKKSNSILIRLFFSALNWCKVESRFCGLINCDFHLTISLQQLSPRWRLNESYDLINFQGITSNWNYYEISGSDNYRLITVLMCAYCLFLTCSRFLTSQSHILRTNYTALWSRSLYLFDFSFSAVANDHIFFVVAAVPSKQLMLEMYNSLCSGVTTKTTNIQFR